MNLGLSTATCHLGSPSPGLEVSTTSFFSSFFLPASFLLPAEAGVLVLLAGVGPLEVCSDWVRLRFSSRKLTISLTSRSSWLQRTEDQQYSEFRPQISPELQQFVDCSSLDVSLQPDIHVSLILASRPRGRLSDIQLGFLHIVLNINNIPYMNNQVKYLFFYTWALSSFLSSSTTALVIDLRVSSFSSWMDFRFSISTLK